MVAESTDQSDSLRGRLEEVSDAITTGEFDEAESKLNSLDADYESADPVTQARIQTMWGELYLDRGQYELATETLEEAWETLRETDHRIRTGNLLATAYRFQGQYSDALEYYDQVLEAVRDEGNRRFEAGLQMNMAVVYNHMGADEQALENYYRSLDIFEELDDQQSLLTTLNNIGELYREADEPERAIEFYTEAVELAREIGSRNDIARSLHNQGLAYRALGEFDLAIEAFEQSLEISREIGNFNRPVQTWNSLGNLYLDQGDLERAETFFLRSMEGSREHGIMQGFYYNHIGLGRLALERGEYQEAEEHFLQAHELALQSGSPELELSTLEHLWQLAERMGAYEVGFGYLRDFQELSDSIRTAERNEALARYERLFELRSERQRRERLAEEVASRTQTIWIVFGWLILILTAAVIFFLLYRRQRRSTREQKKRKSELVQLYNHVDDQRTRLEELNETKNRLFSVLAHDLRRPVSQMHGLVMLLRNNQLAEADREQFLEKVEKEVQNSLSTLEDYLNWAQSQLEGIDPQMEKVDLGILVQQVVEQMKPTASGKSVSLENRVDEGLFAYADAQMTSVVLQNLISNAIKFSHEGDPVVVDLHEEKNMWWIRVIDRGIGIPENMQERLFKGEEKSRKGTRDEAGTGLGLMICRDFAERQQGGIEVQSREGEGAEFRIALLKYNGQESAVTE